MKIKIEITANAKKITREFEGDQQIFQAFTEEMEKQIRFFHAFGKVRNI